MNFFNMFLLSFSALFNLWFYFITSSKKDFNLLKNSAFFSKGNLSFSQHHCFDFGSGPTNRLALLYNKTGTSFSLTEKGQQLQDSYFIFMVAIAIISISVELIMAKKARAIKKDNQLLLLDNAMMEKQNGELQHMLLAMEKTSAENSMALQIIAHDLRSPIAAIVGLSGFMIDENNLADEDIEVISLIHTSGIDSLKFINDILDRESAKMELKKEMVDLHLLLSYCIAQLKYKAIEKSQHIKLESNIPITLKLNREKIWRVVNNLISNALKFSPDQTTITVALHLASEKAIISIKDQGIGIPENLADKIFSFSTQRKREGTAGEKSFGMGLSIAKQNVEAHGGSLSFVSGAGKGTTFFVELPI